MASPAQHDQESTPAPPVLKRRRWVYRVAIGLLIILLALVVYGWIAREQLARDLIGEQLTELGLPATYNVTDISTERQVLTDIVVGDPAKPDLTAERVEIELAYGFGVPEIGTITLIKPKLYGSYLDGKLSFGALDPVLFAESDEPAGLPEWDISLVDGRGLIESDYGDVGLKIEGAGQLDNGFEGVLAAIAPKAQYADCVMDNASIYGSLKTTSGRVSLDGPMRVGALACRDAGLAVRNVGFDAVAELNEEFSGGSVGGSLASGAINAQFGSASGISGPLRLSFAEGNLDTTFDLTAADLRSNQVLASSLRLDGGLRVRDQFENAELQVDIDGQGVELGSPISGQLAGFSDAVQGTLAEPLLQKLRGALDREVRDASIAASLIGRMNGDARSLVIPEGYVRAGGGAQLLSLTRLQYTQNGAQTPRISGNFRVGGRDLPPLVGRMERSGGGQSVFRMRMDSYAAGDSRVAVPEMLVTQAANGTVTFIGDVEASGPLPGGAARGLRMPVNGTWSLAAGLSMWRSCTQIGFDSLAFANLDLSSRNITLCPARGSAIVRQNASGLTIAAGVPSLDVSGSLAGTPIRVSSGPVGLAYPGVATAKTVNVSLGAENEASSVVVSEVLARLDEGIAGSFSGADIGLFAVPIDLQQSSGQWDYTDGVLSISEGQFTLADRAEVPRYEPLFARDASLILEDNVILANAVLRAPKSNREVSKVAIRHDLSSGTGSADLSVDGLLFDDSLQPDELTELATGIVANVKGVVTGAGRIDWNAQDVTSTGAFSSKSLDLAALFGPVKGASGTVEFVDLLSLTTAPDQRIKVASVNPGIEAFDGEIGFSLTDGQFLGVTGGKWPFMGGTLTLRPVDLNFSVAEERRYVLAVEGLDSALFIENMELGNLAATGIFDGELPIVFDELGFGQIKDGVLQSRAGGNVSYVGDLTYEDLSPIVNYAFSTLRSLDYESMRIDIEGPLTGNIVTKLKFDGVSQGEGTSQNFITRQIADLPIQFNVNIKAPFYELVGVLKSIYEPAAGRDPRSLGLLSDDGTRFVVPDTSPNAPAAPQPLPPANQAPLPDSIRPDESAIQTSDSEDPL